MTATPRQLSDAIQADYDEILAGRPDETAAIARWTLARSIAGWIALGTILGPLALLVLTMMTGSLLFFFSLGYGARWLRPIFEKPSAWRILEGIIAITMWAIAFKLVMGA